MFFIIYKPVKNLCYKIASNELKIDHLSWPRQLCWAAQCDYLEWYMKTIFNRRIDMYLSRKIQYLELQVVSIVRNTVRKYFKKNLLFLLR